MTTTAALDVVRLCRALLVVAILGAVAAGALTLRNFDALVPAYRLAVFACLAPAVGSLLFALIHRLTGGQWGESLAPFLIGGARLAPWLWVLALPLLFFTPATAPAWPAYDSRAMLALRAIVYAIILFVVAAGVRRARTPANAWIGPAGFIGLVFTLHLLADDWLGALEPHWHSTAFALVWMTGLAVAGLAVAVGAALLFGISPRESSGTPRALGLDWGNLLLAAMVFWVYVAFAQFLIIWAGNLPREISWFEHRTRGAWAWTPPLLAVLHFVLPFAVLLSRSGKRSPRLLAVVVVLLLLGQVLYAAWLILPAFAIGGLLGGALCGALLVAAGALFLRVYLTAARRRFVAA